MKKHEVRSKTEKDSQQKLKKNWDLTLRLLLLHCSHHLSAVFKDDKQKPNGNNRLSTWICLVFVSLLMYVLILLFSLY